MTVERMARRWGVAPWEVESDPRALRWVLLGGNVEDASDLRRANGFGEG